MWLPRGRTRKFWSQTGSQAGPLKQTAVPAVRSHRVNRRHSGHSGHAPWSPAPRWRGPSTGPPGSRRCPSRPETDKSDTAVGRSRGAASEGGSRACRAVAAHAVAASKRRAGSGAPQAAQQQPSPPPPPPPPPPRLPHLSECLVCRGATGGGGGLPRWEEVGGAAGSLMRRPSAATN